MPALPDKARRVVCDREGRIDVHEFPLQPPGPGEALIETACTLISAGTELGTFETTAGRVRRPGYSNVGRILALGPHDPPCPYRKGDLVVVLKGHADYVTASTRPPSMAPVPAEVSAEEATFAVLGSVSLHGVHKAAVQLGEHAAVSGLGLVGQLALQMLALAGPDVLIAIDFEPMRLRTALDTGATHALNPKDADLRGRIMALTGDRGLDVTVEASGYPEALATAFDLARIGGRIMCLGSIWHRKIEIDFTDLHEKEITLVGCHQPKCPAVDTPYWRWTQQHNRRHVLDLIARRRLNVKRLITHRLPYTDAADAYRLLKEERNRALGVILRFKA
jgi:2-desacetyl-2-hydroxyethyl bacteriochlorophyllide A dehydrogenase